MEKVVSILIVDDNEELCDGMKEYLEHEGYVVEHANSGKDAITLSHNNRYDIALVDIELPDIQGTELVGKLTDISPSTEFIHMTAHASLDSAIEAVKHNKVVSYETKPIDMGRLLSLLDQIAMRRVAEEGLSVNCKNQVLLNKLLEISLEEISLAELLDKMLDMILTASWMPEQRSGGIFLIEDEPGVLLLKAHKGLHPNNIEACDRVPLGRCLCGRAAMGGKIEYAGCEDERHEIIFEGFVPCGSYNVPIILDGQVIGVLLLYLGESYRYEVQEVSFLEVVASSLASMIRRMRYEEELFIAKEEWEMSFNAVRDYICILDMSGSILHANKTMRNRFESVHGNLIGLDYRIVYYGAETLNPMTPSVSAFSGETSVSVESKLPTMEGWYSISSYPIYHNSGKQYGVVFLVHDITEHKKMAEALLQSEKLKSIGIITAGISHEFNNILAIISGNVQLMKDNYKDHEGLIKALNVIMKATINGAEISSKMLDFTKTEVDTTKYGTNDVCDLIKETIEFTMPRWKNIAQANGIDYNMNVEGIRKTREVHCNPTELREVFINIINNALDAMNDGGTITFCSWNKDGVVFVSISDTGMGMTENVMKKIFDPFYTTRRPEGTGLGMSTAFSIISRHGGKVEVKSEEGRGSTFTLQFPAAVKSDSPLETTEVKQEIESKNLQILVVDDEESICDILEAFLSREGHMVRTVDNGAEAIILAEASNYDLVLCDMVMPDIFGYDVVKALNKLERRPKIGIITGWGEKLKPIEDENAKVDFILNKPFDFSEVTEHINNVFSDN